MSGDAEFSTPNAATDVKPAARDAFRTAIQVPASVSVATTALAPKMTKAPTRDLGEDVGDTPGKDVGVGIVQAAEEQTHVPPAATTEKASWNTSKLGLRVGADALAAGSAAALVAPIITAIDKGIIENASGRRSLGESVKSTVREMVRTPLGFFGSRPFGLIFALYLSTYFTANTIDTLSSTVHSTPLQSTTAGTPKFLATSTSNLALCLYKDSRFTQLFGTPSSTPRPVPLPTYALFTVRDCLTIFASFNLPIMFSPYLDRRMSEQMKTYVGSASIAQFVTPAAVQIFSTPLHLLGLDLYNRQNVSASERTGRVMRDWAKSAFARMGRIVPAFGVGGVVNAKVRRSLMGSLEKA